MYRFALRPRWIVSHLIVLALVVLMVNLGLWQLRRLDQRQTTNALVSARTESQPVAVEDLVEPGDGDAAVEAVEYRPAVAEGEWQGQDQVLVRGRSLDEAPGSWVVTPLRLADGSLVAVTRGWIPNDGTLTAVPEQYEPPAGPVSVTGLVRRTEERGRLGATDPSEGRLTDLARVDLDRFGAQLEAPLLPAWLQLTAQTPEPVPEAAPRTLPAPALDEGPHFSYAVQWFTFTLIALIGYPLILRRNAREKAAEAAAARRAAHESLEPAEPAEPVERADPISTDP